MSDQDVPLKRFAKRNWKVIVIVVVRIAAFLFTWKGYKDQAERRRNEKDIARK